ncbi:MAG: hypothetical protein FJ206_15040 [Gemmatimonadetes bacterium]|nr:hypothetical protein [Gemmatimonadota bacterium]
MGFAGLPPKPDQAVAVRALEAWTPRADVAIVHEELPWTELLAGVAPDSILRRTKDELIAYYRGKGLALVLVADANDGLIRGREAPGLRAAGRSIAEPSVQRLYRDWILAFARRYRPEYVGLAAETNLIRVAAPPALYQAVVAVANAAASDLAGLATRPRRFVSVQVETAWGKFTGQPYQGIEADFRDFPFIEVLGLSSYPYVVWAMPSDLPGDYYRRLLDGRTLGVLVVEGGWSSAGVGSQPSDPREQADYFRRHASLLATVDALAWIQLTPTDLDLATFPVELRDLLLPFARLGVLDTDLLPKPALAVWDSLFSRPRR